LPSALRPPLSAASFFVLQRALGTGARLLYDWETDRMPEMSRALLKAVIVAVSLISGIAPPHAALAADSALKTEIEAFLHRAEMQFDGLLHWDGADTFEVNTGDDTATLSNLRFSFRKEPGESKPAASITLDRVEIRRKPAGNDGKLTEFAITLPALSTLVTADGEEIVLSLRDGRATALVE